ncbi:MAG: DNA primase [Microbacteriaceae bacterium]|nr:DNA primase [Microbacteriaceae bacterium]
MAGRIPDSDIEAIKQRVNIADVVGDYVALKRAGVDSMKGLCPFHDERTPSFHVMLSRGFYNCFGCGVGGDAIRFLQEYNHLSFVEAVENLASRCGYVINYEEGGAEKPQGPSKTRLYAAHQAAAEFYAAQLVTTEGRVVAEFLAGRGFDAQAVADFGIGYSPNSWSGLLDHLRGLGFSAAEIMAGGLAVQGSRGLYDRFRGRAMWPIRDTTGQVVGFGARKILESDQGPKYLNSPDSPIYHKSQVFYGIDRAKRAIAKDRRAILVEGYTDVMACHLAGIPHAVATCGTAFGAEHIAVLRRVLGDDARAEVIFTFDPDEAGQAAALKAYGEEKRFSAQTYVAVNESGLDPSDLRQQQGDAALRGLFERKMPLFEFALLQTIKGFDLDSIEGRFGAIRQAAPIVQSIRDASLRPAYVRQLAQLVGMDPAEVQQEINQVRVAAPKQRGSAPTVRQGFVSGAQVSQPGQGSFQVSQASFQAPAGALPAQAASYQAPVSPRLPQLTLAQLSKTPGVRLERDALMALLQRPDVVSDQLFADVLSARFECPPLAQVLASVARLKTHRTDPAWFEQIVRESPESLQSLVRELVIAPLPALRQEQVARYVQQVLIALVDRDLQALKAQLLAKLQRPEASDSAVFAQLQQHLVAIEAARRQYQAISEGLRGV